MIDQFALSMGFRFGINYVASDTIFRHGLLSKLMVALVQPIPFSKGSSDFVAVKNMISVVKDGGCVAMFPSGNRSFFGEENTIVSGIGRLVKTLNAPLVLVQIKGGYNTKARWKAKTNKGKMTASVVKTLQTDELSRLTNEELDKIILDVLSFNEYKYNKEAQIVYRGNHKAEYLESVLFYCPECSSLTGLHSKGNEFLCRDCKMKVRINETGFFERVQSAEKTPETILDWGHKQLDFVKSFDFSPYKDTPLFCDHNISLMKAERAKKEYLLGKGAIELFEDRLCICGQMFYFKDITMAIQGVRKLTIYRDAEVYAVKSPFRTNLMKYMVYGYHFRNKNLDACVSSIKGGNQKNNPPKEYYGY